MSSEISQLPKKGNKKVAYEFGIGKYLTPMELEVATMLALGMKNSEIAEKIGISVKTVDTHRGHVLQKTELRNNVELARWALRQDLVTL